MTELLTAAQMRAIERAAIESGDVTGLELMERAGRGVVDAIFAQWPELAPSRGPAPAPPGYLPPEEGDRRRVVVLCGPGNNGGDGFVVARLLREAGWAVEVFLYGDADKLPPDARVNYERWVELGAVEALTDAWITCCDQPDVLIDALFGLGLNRPLPDELVECFHALLEFQPKWKRKLGRDRRMRSVAVDISSGVCADSGNVLSVPDVAEKVTEDSPDRCWPRFMALAFQADLTVTFHTPNPGHYLSLGSVKCGQVAVKFLDALPPVEIGFPVVGLSESRIQLVEPVQLGRPHPISRYFIDLPKRTGHKYDFGHALILSGGIGKGGAARMAARGALRIGAGAVTVGCPPSALIENAAQVNAVMLRKVKDAGALAEVLEDKRINALCLGPGMGTGAREAALVSAALKSGRRIVLDADALTLLSQDADLFGQLSAGCVLTPHAGEFARLFPDIAARLDTPATTGPAYSKIDATREAAARAGCTVLFKGPDTVIADPDGRCSVNAAVYDRSAPWLATAGAGDVLAGFITGLLARGFAPMQAAEAGAWLHVECARAFGPGLIAEDLPEALPGVLKALGV